MSPADVKSLRPAIKARTFKPVYYLYGDDDYLKDEEARLAMDAAVEDATRAFNLEVRRGGELDAETLGSLVNTPPMMADRRVVVIREVNALGKDARAMLDRYLARPADDVLLLLVAPSGVKPDKELTARTAAIEYKPLTGDRLPRWITYYVEHDLATTITDGAAALLQSAVGAELGQLKTELDKIANYAGGAPINEAAVAAVVGVRPGETLGDFLDAVARRDAAAALHMVPGLLEQPKVNAVTIVMALAVQTIVIGWAQAARERGVAPSRLTADVFSLLKSSGGVFTGRPWGDFVATCVRASDLWSARAIDAALESLLATDAAAKDTRLSSDEQMLSTLVLSLCGVAPRRRAA
jgi:DNA polymerase III subunit delta